MVITPSDLLLYSYPCTWCPPCQHTPHRVIYLCMIRAGVHNETPTHHIQSSQQQFQVLGHHTSGSAAVQQQQRRPQPQAKSAV